jgi:hypothetical protein
MINRCNAKSGKSYKLYSSRGIVVCERWRHDFLAFESDMGPRPSPRHSIDRIDVNGNYEPDNCRWATSKEQARNTRTNLLVTYKGEKMSLAKAADLAGVNYYRARQRLISGKTEAEALS